MKQKQQEEEEEDATCMGWWRNGKNGTRKWKEGIFVKLG